MKTVKRGATPSPLYGSAVTCDGVRRFHESCGRGGREERVEEAWFDPDPDPDTDPALDFDGYIKWRRTGGGNGLRCHLSARQRLCASLPFRATCNSGRVA